MAYFRNRRPACIVRSAVFEIPLGFLHAAVSEVRRQVRQQPLHVLALTVPTDQSIQRERVAEVVQAWSERPTGRPLQPGLLPDALEDQLGRLAQDATTVQSARNEVSSRRAGFLSW